MKPQTSHLINNPSTINCQFEDSFVELRGEGSKGTIDCGAVLRKKNPLYLPERVIKTMKKATEKILEEKAVNFLKKMGQNNVKIVKKLEEAPPQVSIPDLILALEDH